MLEKIANFVVKRRWIVIGVTLIITIFFIYQMKNLYFNNRFTEWIPKNDPVLKLLLDTGEKFGSNELVMVAFKAKEGKTFSPEILNRLKLLTEELKERKEIFLVTSLINMPDIKRIEDGIEIKDFLENIPQDKNELERLKNYALSKETFINNVISSDGNWLAMAIYIKSGGDPIATFGKIIKPIVEKHLFDKADIYYSGDPSDAYFANEFTTNDLMRLIPIIILAILIILYLSFRSFKGVIFPSLVVLIATIWVFGLMGFLHRAMNLITPALPVLLIALGSAYGIHVLNKIFHEVNSETNKFSKLKIATTEIFIPVLMAGVTTIVGFASFITAKLNIIIEFGLLAGVGILFAMIISLTLIPAGYAVMPVSKKSITKYENHHYSLFLNPLSKFVKNHPKLVLFLAVLIFILFLIRIPKITREVNFAEYYPEKSQPRLALDIVKEHFGGAYPITIYFNAENIKSASSLRIIRRAENYLYSLPNVSMPFSIADFIQEMNFQLNGRYHIPDKDGGVSNLWFFMEGRDELKQIITNDLKESLIFSKIPNPDTKFMKNIYAEMSDFLKNEFSRDFIEYKLDILSEKDATNLRREEAKYVMDEISWLVNYYGKEKSFNRNKAQEKLFLLIDKMPKSYDDDVRKIIEKEFKNYIFSEYFDFEVSDKIKSKLYDRLYKSVLKNNFNQENIRNILKETVPFSEYDEEIACDVANTLYFRVEEAKKLAFAERAYKSLKDFFPEKAIKNENFCKKMKGLFYEIADNLIVLPSNKIHRVKSISKNIVKFEEIDQSGFPAALTRLDHFLYVSQFQSLILAFIVTFILMTLMRGSFILGGISVTPILFTLGVIYGFLGWTKIPLDYATMMIAGISIGVGIDYAIHFIHGVGLKVNEGHVLEEAVHLAYLEKGKAILANSIAVMAGFAVLLLSSMSPLHHFGGTMVGSMFLAAFSTLTILPALILIIKPKIGGKK